MWMERWSNKNKKWNCKPHEISRAGKYSDYNEELVGQVKSRNGKGQVRSDWEQGNENCPDWTERKNRKKKELKT